MKKISQIQQHKSRKLLKFLGSLLTASFLLFGAVSCNQGGSEAGETEIAEEEFATEGAEVSNEAVVAENDLAVNGIVKEFEQWDQNNDQQWDEKEFKRVVEEKNFFDQWDTVDDKVLTEEELYEAIFSTYDKDSDNFLDVDEFNTWNTAWGGNFKYDEWNTSGDNLLYNEEFLAGVKKADVFQDWDRDNNGSFTEIEVTAGLFNTWDENNDGNISNDEYNKIGYVVWGF